MLARIKTELTLLYLERLCTYIIRARYLLRRFILTGSTWKRYSNISGNEMYDSMPKEMKIHSIYDCRVILHTMSNYKFWSDVENVYTQRTSGRYRHLITSIRMVLKRSPR